jgi:hypothetical protein
MRRAGAWTLARQNSRTMDRSASSRSPPLREPSFLPCRVLAGSCGFLRVCRMRLSHRSPIVTLTRHVPRASFARASGSSAGATPIASLRNVHQLCDASASSDFTSYTCSHSRCGLLCTVGESCDLNTMSAGLVLLGQLARVDRLVLLRGGVPLLFRVFCSV